MENRYNNASGRRNSNDDRFRNNRYQNNSFSGQYDDRSWEGPRWGNHGNEYENFRNRDLDRNYDRDADRNYDRDFDRGGWNTLSTGYEGIDYDRDTRSNRDWSKRDSGRENFGNRSYEGYGNRSYGVSNDGYGNRSYGVSNDGYGNRSYGVSNDGYGNRSYGSSYLGSSGYGSRWGRAGDFTNDRYSRDFSGNHGYSGNYESSSDRGLHFGKGPKGYKRSDERIREDANDALTYDPYVDAIEIEVQVQDGVITLSGVVEDRKMKRAAEECVENVRGVSDVKNELKVRNANLWDKITGNEAKTGESSSTASTSASSTGNMTGLGTTKGDGKSSTSSSNSKNLQ